MRDTCKDGRTLRALFHKLELPVKALHDLYNCVAHQNDRSGFHNICLTTLKHGYARSLQARKFVFRKLDDEERFAVFLPCDPLYEQGSQENQQDTDQIHCS